MNVGDRVSHPKMGEGTIKPSPFDRTPQFYHWVEWDDASGSGFNLWYEGDLALLPPPLRWGDFVRSNRDSTVAQVMCDGGGRAPGCVYVYPKDAKGPSDWQCWDKTVLTRITQEEAQA